MIIEASGIEKSFGTLKVLKGVDITVEKGDSVSDIGNTSHPTFTAHITPFFTDTTAMYLIITAVKSI